MRAANTARSCEQRRAKWTVTKTGCSDISNLPFTARQRRANLDFDRYHLIGVIGVTLVLGSCSGAGSMVARVEPHPISHSKFVATSLTAFTLHPRGVDAPTLNGKVWRSGSSLRLELRSTAHPEGHLVASLISNATSVTLVDYERREIITSSAMYDSNIRTDIICIKMIIAGHDAGFVASTSCVRAQSLRQPDGHHRIELLTGSLLELAPTESAIMSDKIFQFHLSSFPKFLPKFSRK